MNRIVLSPAYPANPGTALKHGRIYLDNLNAKLIVLREGGHFADFDNVVSLQEVIDEINIVENNK
jgi:hypothetical protein